VTIAFAFNFKLSGIKRAECIAFCPNPNLTQHNTQHKKKFFIVFHVKIQKDQKITFLTIFLI